MTEQNSQNSLIPLNSIVKLKGKSNYTEWSFLMNLLIRKEKFGSTKKVINENLELRLQTLIATSVSEHVLTSITHCTSYNEMLLKLEALYGKRTDDLQQLYSEYHNFKYDNNLTALENVNRLEALKFKIEKLGDVISEAAFKATILNILPKRFSGIISGCHLKPDLTLAQLIDGLDSEDLRLTRLRNVISERNPKNTMTSGAVCLVNKPGNQVKNSHTTNKSASNEKNGLFCRYCKAVGQHTIDKCPELEKRKNSKCFKCGAKGHYSKNCTADKVDTDKTDKTSAFVACINHSSLDDLHSAFSSTTETLKRVKIDPNTWVMDCACTAHVCNNRSNFQSLMETSTGLTIGDNQVINVKEIGTVRAKCASSLLEFQNVLFNPSSPANLISVIKLLQNGWEIKEFTLTEIVLSKNNQHEIRAPLDSKTNLWIAHSIEIVPPENIALLSLHDWHRSFAHQNIKHTKKILKQYQIQYTNTNVSNCMPCLKGKAIRPPFRESGTKSKAVGDLVHSDLLTAPSPSLGKSKYALVLKDDYTKYRTVYFLKTKDNTVKCFEHLFRLIKTQTGNKVKCLRTDNGTEEDNKEINKLCHKFGIIHETSCTYTPEQNGKIEREMRTESEAATTLLIDSNLSNEFWAEAINYTVFTLNRTANSNVEGKSPYEVFFNKKPFDIRFLRPFGLKVVAHIPKCKRRKFNPKGEEGIFVGYSPTTKGYKVYIPESNTFEITRSVRFNIEEKIANETNEEIRTEPEPEEIAADDDVLVTEIDLDWTDDESEDNRETAMISYLSIPERFNDLKNLNENDREFWMRAVREEFNSMIKNGVWKFVPHKKQPLVDTKWVFRLKDTELGQIPRARLVARGFKDKTAANTITYAPVVSIVTVRAILAVARQKGLIIRTADIETAFLNGHLTEPVYLKPPQGLDVKKGIVLELQKSLYGLKQAPKCFYDKIDSVLTKAGFERSKHDYCLYVKSSETEYIIIALYVDDLLIAASNENNMRYTLEVLKTHFTVKVAENVRKFIGIEIVIDDRETAINQKTFIESSADKFKVSNCRPIHNPMEPKLDLSKSNSPQDKKDVKPFQRLVGTLRYIAERTRPDISFSLGKLSQYSHVATPELYTYLLRVLKYLVTTKDLKLVYKKGCEKPLEAYCDASWANDENRKSISGYIIRIFGCIVQYKTQKQTMVALSTAEAEYIALSECCRELIWLRGILADLKIDLSDLSSPVNVFEDNQSTIKIAENRTNYKRTKHVDIKYHHVKDLVSKGLVHLVYVESNKQIADGMTKSLPNSTFGNFVKTLHLH